MKKLLAALAVAAIASTAHAQTLEGNFDGVSGGPISVTAVGGDVNAAGLDFLSAGGNLIPIPPGDLTAPAAPFTFLLANSPNQVTYGNLGTNVTLADGSITALSVGAKAGVSDIEAAWGNGPIPVSFNVSASMPGGASDLEPCPVGPFTRAFCLYDTPVGEIGGPINISVPPTTVTVPVNPDGTDDVDVFVLLENEITAPPEMSYTTTFSWPEDDAVAPGSLVFREWVGNFNYDPPRAIPLTYVNKPAGDETPAEEPPEFEWIVNAAGLAVGAKVGPGLTDPPDPELAGWRSVEGLPENVPKLERYHFQIAGLAAGTNVTFTKDVVGGEVVPEPASGTIAMLGLGLLGLLRRRR